MKKILILLVAIIMILSLVCCKKADKNGKSGASDTSGSSHSRAKDSSKGYKIGEGPEADNEDDLTISGDANGESESEIRDSDGD